MLLEIFERFFGCGALYRRHSMKTVLALLSLALAASAAGDSGYHAQFVGGTLAGVPAKSKAQLNLTAPDALIFVCRGQTLEHRLLEDRHA